MDDEMCTPIDQWIAPPQAPPFDPEPEPPQKTVRFADPVVTGYMEPRGEDRAVSHPYPHPVSHPAVQQPSRFDITDPFTWGSMVDVQWISFAWIVVYISFTIHKDFAPPSTVPGVAIRSGLCVLLLFIGMKMRPSV